MFTLFYWAFKKCSLFDSTSLKAYPMLLPISEMEPFVTIAIVTKSSISDVSRRFQIRLCFTIYIKYACLFHRKPGSYRTTTTRFQTGKHSKKLCRKLLKYCIDRCVKTFLDIINEISNLLGDTDLFTMELLLFKKS